MKDEFVMGNTRRMDKIGRIVHRRLSIGKYNSACKLPYAEVPFARVLIMLVLMIPMSGLQSQDTPDAGASYEAIEALSYDSLSNIYRAIYQSDLDSASLISKVHYMKAEDEGNKIELIRALNNRATNNSLLNEHKNAVKHIDEALRLKMELGDTILEDPKTYYNAGFVYAPLDQAKAIKYYYRAIPEYELRGDSASIADIYTNIGHMYMSTGNFEEALDNMEKAKNVYERMPDKGVDPYILHNIGKVKLKQGKFHEAIHNLYKAEVLFRKNNILTQIVYSKAFRTEAYHGLGLVEKALDELESASSLADSLENESAILFINPVLARFYINSDMAKAEKYIRKATYIDDSKKTIQNKADIYQTLSYIQKVKGNLEESLKMQQLHTLYLDSIANEYNEADIVKEEMAIEHEKKIQQLENKHEEGNEETSQRHTLHLSLIIGLGLLLLIGGSLFYRKRSAQQAAEKNVLLQEIEKLKAENNSAAALHTQKFELDREKIEASLGKSVNETDWNVMNVLLEDPVITNKGIAEKVFLSVDGIGSSLRRMYQSFDIKESRYMKVSLIMKLMRISNS